MRSTPVVGIAIAFAIAFAMLAGAGWTAQAGGGGGDIVVDDVSDTANNSPVGIKGDTGNSDDGDIIGFIINGSTAVKDFLLLGLTVGSALGNLGFPRWFVEPLGWAIQMILMVAFTQFAVNRVLR